MTTIIEKEISGATVEIGLEPRAFNTFEAFTQEVGNIGPFKLFRGAVSPSTFTLYGEDGVEMRINVKDILVKCATELHALVEGKKE